MESDPQRALAALIATNKESILREWTRRVLEDPSVPRAAILTEPALRDHVPSLLDEVITRLTHTDATDGEDAVREQHETASSRAHALHRVAAHYDLAAVMRELSHLRSTLVELIISSRTPTSEESTPVMHAMLDETMATAALTVEAANRDALQASDSRYRALSESGLLGVIVATLDGEICDANDAFLTMLGYTRDDVKHGHISWSTITPPGWAALDARVARALSERHSFGPFEKEYLHHDGRRVPVQVGMALIEGIEARCVAYVMDLTERRDAEVALAREADFKERVMAILGHDLRQPIGSVVFNAATLLRQDHLDAAATRIARRIAAASDRAATLVSDLLDFTRVRRTGTLPIDPKPIDLAAVVRQTVDEAEATHAHRSIRLDTVPSCIGTWDPARMSQVVSNLVANALTYSPPDSDVQVTVRVDAGDAVIEVHNRNSGDSIAPKSIPTLFDPYHRGANANRSESSGLGLGLHIAEQIVRAHGGRIDVESDEAHGTTFRVVIPRDPSVT